MARIAHYLERWLELSAGFVATAIDQSRHDGLVISRDGWLNLEAYDYHPRRSLTALRQHAPDRLKPLALRTHLGAVLAAARSDLVHVHFGYAANDVLSATRRRPYVLSLHGHDVTGLLAGEPDRYRPVVAAVDAVIVPSRFLADAAVAAGFPDDRIHLIPSGVDTSFFTPTPLPDGPPIVVFIGRFVEKKGIDTLIAAWPTISAAVPDAELRLLGDGPLLDRLPVADARLTRIAPDPTRRHDQVRDLIRSSTVVVTPSRTGSDGDSESLVLVNLEAGASGRPVVSTRHGGIPEFVSAGETGLLVEPADPAALAAAVIAVLREASLAARLGTAAIDHVAQWDSRNCTRRVDNLYDTLLAARN